MAGISITLHGDVPYASEAHKKEFCSQCDRVQGEWTVYQKPKSGAWFKKCKVCKGEVLIKNPKAIEKLNKEKVRRAAQKAKPSKSSKLVSRRPNSKKATHRKRN